MDEIEKLLGKTLDEFHIQIHMGHLMWEEKLKLHLRPRPSWCSQSVWGKIVSLVVVQSVQGGAMSDTIVRY
jgi:hypothetical protein